MVDRDKIIKALEWCESNFKCDECPYHDTEYICCEDALRHDVLLLLKGEPEAPHPVRESTLDFVRFTHDKNEILIRRDQITYALYDSTEDKTYVYLAGEKTCYVYRKNILDLITGGE